MNEQIKMIIKDLAVLKEHIPQKVMIGQLKISCKKSVSKISNNTISWTMKKRKRGKECIYRVKFDKSYCISEATFLSKAMETLKHETRSSDRVSENYFSIEAINSFLIEADDPNTIHRGSQPVVPGLMIIDKLISYLAKDKVEISAYQIKFISPLFANEIFTIKEMENSFHILNMMGESIAVLTMEENNE